MKKKKTKLSMSLSVLIIGFLISTSSLNINSTKALLEGENNQFNTDSFDSSAWIWNITEVVSTESTGYSRQPSLAVDSTGNIHIAWLDSTNLAGAGTDSDIFYKFWDTSTSSWITTEVVSTESTGTSYTPSLAVDTSGNIHIAWLDFTNFAGAGTDIDIFYKRWNASSSTWTTTEVVSTESTGDSQFPSLAVDSAGNVHIAWHDRTDYASSGTDTDIFYKRWNASTSSWTPTEVVSTESTEFSAEPSLVVDSSGNVHVAWHDETDYAGSGINHDIFYKHWNASSTSWTLTEVVSTESTTGYAQSPSLAVDSIGNVYVAWQDTSDYPGAAGTDYDIFYKRWEAFTSSWTLTEVVSTESTGFSMSPSLAVDSAGNVHIAWEDFTNFAGAGTDGDIFYKRWDSASSIWIISEVVSTESTDGCEAPSIGVDTDGRVFVAWDDFTDYAGSSPSPDIFYKRSIVPPTVPELAFIVPNPTEFTTINLDWNNVFGATDYYVYRSTSYIWSVEGLVPITTISSSNYIDIVPSEGFYYYVVVAGNLAGNSSLSNCQYVEVIFSAPDSPELAPILPNPTDSDNVPLAWNNVNGATDYYVYRSPSYIWSVEGLVPITTISSSNYIDIVPSEGFYYYVVVAGNLAGNSSLSNCQYVEVKFIDLETPELSPILPNPTDSDNVPLAWNNVFGATDYYVYRSTSYIWSVEGLVPITTISSSNYIDIVPSEGFYYYVVVAGNLAGNSSLSNCQYVEVKFIDLETPELSPILPNPTDSDSISLVWDSIDEASEYSIYRSTSYIWSVEGLTPIDTISSTSYIDTLPTEGYYFYVIVASDGVRNSTHSNCEHVEYKVPHLREFSIVSGLILAAFALVFVVTRIRKKNFKLN